MLGPAALWYSTVMPNYYWDEEKDALLRRTRRVSFDDIVYQIEHGGGLLDDIAHPNPTLHPGQRIYIVRIRDYAYRVPFEVTELGTLLRTIYPSYEPSTRVAMIPVTICAKWRRYDEFGRSGMAAEVGVFSTEWAGGLMATSSWMTTSVS